MTGNKPQHVRRLFLELAERLVKLYEARGNEGEVATWRSALATARASSLQPATDGSK